MSSLHDELYTRDKCNIAENSIVLILVIKNRTLVFQEQLTVICCTLHLSWNNQNKLCLCNRITGGKLLHMNRTNEV